MSNRFYKLFNPLTVTLRFSILAIFISLFVSTLILITIFSSISYKKSMTYIANELMQYASDSVLHELTNQVNIATTRSQISAHLIEQNVLQVKAQDLIPYTFNLIRDSHLEEGAFWGDEQGNFYYSVKNHDNSVTSHIYNRQLVPPKHFIIKRDSKNTIVSKTESNILDFDPRNRPWYIKAKKYRHSIWTNLYYFKPDPDLGITVATPAFLKGKLYGVFGIDINLEYLAQFIKQQNIREHGFCFIITKDGNLIVSPDNQLLTKKTINAQENLMPLITQTLAIFNQSKTKQMLFSYSYNGQMFVVSYKPVQAITSNGWLIGVIVPESDFTSDLKTMSATTLFIGLSILILGMLLISWMISFIVKPIRALVKETQNIQHFDLEAKVPVSSSIKEIIYLRDAVSSMKNGLKLFQKYIPKALVEQLIESGEDIRVGGVRKKLAVFFSDIEGFTSIIEKTDANLFMTQISEYFDELTQIIMNEKGTIDKYIGDSIMAFWGSPLPEIIPCHHAAAAAIRCQLKLMELNAKWEKEGRAHLDTRIGIHTGYAIVGNIGSSERLNYTAIGDTINIASRLEEINKTYKTKILVSDAVYKEIKDTFILRMIDCIVLKGRTTSSYIYELLGDDLLELSFDIIRYRPIFSQGFHAYQNQQWDEAITYFRECLQIYPQDSIAPIFIERCLQFKFN